MKALCLAEKLMILAALIAASIFIFNIATAEDLQLPSLINFTGNITNITGAVNIYKAREKGWVPARIGMELDMEDRIMTGPASSTDIVFVRSDNCSKVRILENADMSLKTLNLDKVTGDSQILLDLAIGHIIIKTDRLKGRSRFEVLTPTSMTAVRGTGFEVNVTREEGHAANAFIAK